MAYLPGYEMAEGNLQTLHWTSSVVLKIDLGRGEGRGGEMGGEGRGGEGRWEGRGGEMGGEGREGREMGGVDK